MDRAVTFMEEATQSDTPFFCVIWFHAPHWPVVTNASYRNLYPGLDEFTRSHFGTITAMDEQIGRLRKKLREYEVEQNTMLWFCSDNGPEGSVEEGSWHGAGSAGPFKGRKRDLFEGGIRVPAILEWPERVQKGTVTEMPMCTSDYFPTICDALGIQQNSDNRPYDGISLLPFIQKANAQRAEPIAFESGKRQALIDNRYKLITVDKGVTFMLFDVLADPGETNDLAVEQPDIVQQMKIKLEAWRESCSRSAAGADYTDG
jgi:arylsulfatase A-like enzyme